MRRTMRGLLALLLVLGVWAGCRDPEPGETALTREEFTEILVELREAEREIGYADSAVAQFEARREEILAAHGATEEDLRSFVEAYGRDLDELQAVWDTLNQRLKHVPTERERDRLERQEGYPVQ